MEDMYQQYKDIVDFRLIYIKEAHASDSRRPVKYAKEKGITEHDDYKERCVTAELFFQEQSLTIPCLVDHMDDSVNSAFKAWPDRVFVVRKDGRLAVAASRGPWGFEPALLKAKDWLQEYKKSGKEPELPGDAADAGKEQRIEPKSKKQTDDKSKDK